MNQFHEMRLFAENIARRTGDEILMKGFVSDNKGVTYKSSTNLVTDIDRASEAFLYGEIRAAYPDHAILAEEGSAAQSDHDLIWLVDPLDATNNFAHGIPHFCTSIGLYSRSKNQTMAGAIYDPVRKELFSAERGGGVSLNGKPIRVSAIDSLEVSLLTTGFPYEKRDGRINNVAQFSAFLPNVQCIRRMGSAGLDMCYVAAGRFEGFWEPLLHPWDTAAGDLIVTEAGGVVTNYRGEQFTPFCPEVVASNGLIHKAMINTIVGSTEMYPRDVKR
jgi:myo-inositol-1(or 4)-monophosphatase